MVTLARSEQRLATPVKSMKTFLALIVVAALGTAGLAAEIRKGATMQVRANSIWFEEADKLEKWQALKKGGDAAALAAFEKKTLGERDAWQFINP